MCTFWKHVAIHAVDYKSKLEEASTHNSAKIHAGNVFVSRDLDLWPFDTKYMAFQDSSWNVFMWNLVILAASVFEISLWQNRQTRTNEGKNPTSATAVGVGS